MPSRRDQIQLTPQEIAEFLISEKTVVIVSNGRDGYPHPMPMWFCVDRADSGHDDTGAGVAAVYCTTFARSQKVVNLRRDPRATLLVESGEEYAQLKSVVIYAATEVLEDHDAVVDTLVRISTKGREIAAVERERLAAGVAATAAKRVVLKFIPQRWVSWDHAKLGGRY